MQIYLVQHGQAKPKERDPDRPLTPEGARGVRNVCDFLEPVGLCVRAIWHSGRTRAAQTAEILSEAVAAEEGLRLREGLAPSDPVGPVARKLLKMTDDLAIVGHMPFLARLASLLLVGDEAAQPVAFQQGGVVCLRRGEDARWQVAWMIVPELFAS